MTQAKYDEKVAVRCKLHKKTTNQVSSRYSMSVSHVMSCDLCISTIKALRPC